MDRRDDRDGADGDSAGGDADRWDRGDAEPGDPAGNGTGPDDRSADREPADDEARARDDEARAGDGDPRDDDGRSAASVATEGEEWRFSTDDLGRTDELSPGDPDLENVLFVLLGVAVALAVLAQFLPIP